MVSEVWCRNIFRQLLQVLERQYSLQLPHRMITPDTVIFHDDGSPALLPSLISDPGPEVADDLTALARMLHYAITLEPVPAAPLHGRGLEGYSASLITAIDRSLAFDPARRPQSIGELRDLLGIVACKPTPLARQPTRAVQTRAPRPLAPQARAAPLPRKALPQRRRVMAGGAVLLAAGLAVFAGLRGSGSVALDRTAPPPAPAPAPLASRTPGPPIASAVPAVPGPDAGGTRRAGATMDAAQTRTSAAAGTSAATDTRAAAGINAVAGTSLADNTSLADRTNAAGGSTLTATGDTASPLPGHRAKAPAGGSRTAAALPLVPATPPTAPGAAAQAVPPVRTARSAAFQEIRETRAAAPGADAVVSLHIRPWGVVYVDGVKRGISPPVKQLAMAPGRHAVLVTNPGARDRMLEVDASAVGSHVTVDFDGVPETGAAR